MSSYFDNLSSQVGYASEHFRDPEKFREAVATIEQHLIDDITIITGDREFPEDLRQHALNLIANCHVGNAPHLPARQEAIDYLTAVRSSTLIESMHSLFHTLASRRIQTRFGLLDDSPISIRVRRDEHDSEGAQQ